MRGRLLPLHVIVVALCVRGAVSPMPLDRPAPDASAALLVRFEPVDPRSLGREAWVATTSAYDVLVAADGLWIDTERRSDRGPAALVSRPAEGRATSGVSGLHLSFANARSDARLVPQQPLPGVTHYLDPEPARSRTHVPGFGRVRAEGLYEGIDAELYTRDGLLEIDFVVSPGADPSRIGLTVEGSESIRVDRGHLRIGDALVLKAPASYQYDEDGRQKPVQSRLTIDADGRAGFALGDYDRDRALVIDPVVLYETRLPHTDAEPVPHQYTTAFTVDAWGNAYVALLRGSFVPPSPSAWIIKLDRNGQVVYQTRLGSTAQWPMGLAVDASERVFICGGDSRFQQGLYTTGSYRFETATPTQYYAPLFIAQLTSDGASLGYAARLGINGDALGISIDGAGNAYVTGRVREGVSGMVGPGDFPVGADAFQPAFGGGPSDGYLVKLNASGTALTYATFIGGNGGDVAIGNAADADGNIAVTGATSSTDFPLVNATQSTLLGQYDAFVLSMPASGASLTFSTYYGTAGPNDAGWQIVRDAADHLLVAGVQDWYPTIARFSPSGQRIYAASFGARYNRPEGLGAIGSDAVVIAQAADTGSDQNCAHNSVFVGRYTADGTLQSSMRLGDTAACNIARGLGTSGGEIFAVWDIRVEPGEHTEVYVARIGERRLRVDSVSPAVLDPEAHTRVEIHGSGFEAGATVRFGGVEGIGVDVASDTVVSAIARPHAPGTVDVTVTNPDGTSATLAAALFYHTCRGAAPGADWVCVNGGWVPPDHPLASSPLACTTTRPAADWVCVNGGWVPPANPPPSSPLSCTTTRPAVNWVCINGGWVPPDHPLASSPLPCTTTRPAADWVCVNGGWVPPNHPLARGGGGR